MGGGGPTNAHAANDHLRGADGLKRMLYELERIRVASREVRRIVGGLNLAC